MKEVLGLPLPPCSGDGKGFFTGGMLAALFRASSLTFGARPNQSTRPNACRTLQFHQPSPWTNTSERVSLISDKKFLSRSPAMIFMLLFRIKVTNKIAAVTTVPYNKTTSNHATSTPYMDVIHIAESRLFHPCLYFFRAVFFYYQW
jgi:hypothetical protein